MSASANTAETKTARRAGSSWIRADKRLALYLRDGHRCAYCGCDLSDEAIGGDRALRTLDHIRPHVQGGSNEASNLVTACRSCNSSRQDSPLRTWARARGLDVGSIVARVTRQRRRSLSSYRAAARAIIAREGEE